MFSSCHRAEEDYTIFWLLAERTTKVVKRAREVFPNLVAAKVIPGATHYLPTRYHAHLNERCERVLRETT